MTQESVLLSTCNRFELYALCLDSEEGKEQLLHFLSETRHVPLSELEGHCYGFVDEQAVSHLFGVACGLYSLVPGEPQIQGQVVEALEEAQRGGSAGPIMSALFRAAIVAGKRARRETGISRNAASVSHVAVRLARQLFPQLNDACVLLIGTGKMSEIAARNLCDNGARRLVVMNRTHARSVEFAQRYGAVQRPLTELLEALIEADVVISSTSTPGTIITLELVQQALSHRNDRPLLLIDIALPRDVDAAVANLAGVHLYNLDEVQAAVSEGIHLRLQERAYVQAIIAEEVNDFERWLRSLSVVDTISDLQQHTEALRQQELARTMRRLSPTLSERESDAIQELTTRLVNKLLHTPMLRLKDAASAGQGPMYEEALRYLFALEKRTDEPHHDRDKSQQTGDDTDTVGDRAIATVVAEAGDHYRADSYDG